MDPNFRQIDPTRSISECAWRAIEEVLYMRHDDHQTPVDEENRSCETEIEKDERVVSAHVSIDGQNISVNLVTSDNEKLQLNGLLDDEKIEVIINDLL